MAVTPDHELPPEKEAGRWREGEFVDVMPYTGTAASHPRFVNLHLRNCPLSLAQLKEKLLQSSEDSHGNPMARRKLTLNPTRVQPSRIAEGRGNKSLDSQWSVFVRALGRRDHASDRSVLADVAEKDLL